MLRTSARFIRPAGARAYAIPVNNVCREWRCNVDNEETAEKLDKVLGSMQSKIPSKNVQRLVCKAEWDYKVISTVSMQEFGEWKANSFEPEASFMDKLKATPGVTNVKAQAYVVDQIKK
ncbi:hypothetical protein DIPPA_24150 [Diplonema papillatum]|nr:hypothetical protein DIPPA_24150 [Diplonema papillatum]